MKTPKSIIAIIALVIVATAVAIVSCKKEKQEQQSYNVEQSVQSADNMDEYLLSFKKKLLSAQKGEETISLEQARRDLGNLLNFDFGDANYVSNVFQHDTLYLKLTTKNEMVDLAELSTVYKQAFASVKEIYSKVNFPEKSVYLISCKLVQDNKDEDVDVQVIVTTRGNQPENQKTGFNETDNWKVYSLNGKCDGTCVGNDHLTMLLLVYNNTKEMVSCANGRLYYTDPGDGTYIGFNFPEENPSAPHYNMHFRLWCGSADNIDYYCVGYEEMRYYLENIWDILENYVFLDVDQVVTYLNLSIVPFHSNYYGDKLTVQLYFQCATFHCTNTPLSD